MFGGSMSVVNEEEMGSIRAAAVDTGTFMKAPNGEPTNLTERQWLQVRTRAFKDWFGDWEREASLTFDDTQYSNKDCLEALAKEAGKPFVYDESGISADINRKQRDKITSGKAQRKSKDAGFSTGTHNYVAAHIRDLFKYAVHLGDYEDARNNPEILAIKRFACPARINGELAYVYMTVKETKLYGHRIYTLELDTIEKLGGNLDEHFKEMVNPTPSGVTLQKLKEKVNAFFENSSKIVDENGEPLVVYHGTPNHGFTVFDTKRQGERDHGDFGKGFYFTPSKEYAKTYTLPGYLNFGGDASKVYAVFINMRKPLYHNAYWGSPGYVDEEAHDGIIVGNDKYEELPYSHPKNFSEIVAVKPNRQGFYLHEVEVKEKLGNVFKTSTEGGTRQASRSILARWNDKVNTIFENCSKVVDENGEPEGEIRPARLKA